ncbi:MAG: GHMP kinase, partial [Nitrospinota bacterium]
MIIRSKAPLRLGFGGGGTDVHPFCRQEGGAVLNATISQYAYTTIITVDTPDITIQSLDFKSSVTFSKSENYSLDGEMKLAKGVISRLCEGRDQGFKLFTKCDAPPGSGLGSSSTMVVSLIGAFSEWWRLPYDNYTIAKLAYDIERHDLA